MRTRLENQAGETGGKIGGYETRRARRRGETGQKKNEG